MYLETVFIARNVITLLLVIRLVVFQVYENFAVALVLLIVDISLVVLDISVDDLRNLKFLGSLVVQFDDVVIHSLLNVCGP